MRDGNSQLTNHKSALVALSGGVDSAVAALLAKRGGFDCAGAAMVLFEGGDKVVADAQSVADRLGIPFYTFDFAEYFAKHVIDPFIADYREGRTPNPCVVCNKFLKFGSFLDKSRELGKDCVVTGHYAQVECDKEVFHQNDGKPTGRYLLKRGADLSKDQSYALYTLTQEQLSRTVFPLGGLTKAAVREIALEAGFDNANKSESQDICFIPDGDYVEFIKKYTGESPPKGRFVDADGKNLGENEGVTAYTVGQRRGLGLAMPHPSYVLELRPEDNSVVVGKEEMLYSKSLCAVGINLIPFDKIDAPIRASVKIRYSDPGHPATVQQTGEDSLHIEFDEPQRAITKGQAAVLYDGDFVIGGGTIA